MIPQNAIYHNNIAALLKNILYEHKTARSHYELAIKHDSTNASYHHNIAVLLKKHFT
eukprot:UN10022